MQGGCWGGAQGRAGCDVGGPRTLKPRFCPQIGEERATAIALMRKFIAYQFTDTVRPRGDGRRGGGGTPWCPQRVPNASPRPPAPADQVGGGPRARQGLHLRGGLQADARQAGDRGGGQPAHGLLEPADGPHQGDDRRPQGGEGGHQPQAQVVGAPQTGDLQGRHRPGEERTGTPGWGGAPAPGSPHICTPQGRLRGAQPEPDLPQDDPPHRLRPHQSPHEPGKGIGAAAAAAPPPPLADPLLPPAPQKDWFAKRKKFKRPPQRLFDAEKIR